MEKLIVVENSKQAIEAELNVEYNVSIVNGKGWFSLFKNLRKTLLKE